MLGAGWMDQSLQRPRWMVRWRRWAWTEGRHRGFVASVLVVLVGGTFKGSEDCCDYIGFDPRI